MDLSKLQPPKGRTRTKKRVGRGQGSGNGKTAGRGHKGRSLAQASAGSVDSKVARCRYTAEFRNVGFITRFVLITP